ncbi:MAG: pyridoxamine 5'-phosphate oxidase family protein [Anaerolineaceae bacterium]|jgi:nitroimidazol reductase NimA-like FMN-containing flavoprotein (pyridoxamine 5'-phosphate oxidase superfamily)
MEISKEKKQFIDTFLEEPLLARIATADRSGQPHVIPVWYGWDGESLWISSYSNTRKIQDLEENSKIAIAIDVAGEKTETKAVIFEGQADLVKGPPEFLHKQILWIYKRYLGEKGVLDKDPQEWLADPHNLLIKLVPEKIITWQW